MKRILACLLLSLTVHAAPGYADNLNVVYHLSDAEKVSFILNNIRNHIDGVGGPQNVRIVLVMHGPAVAAFNDIEAVDRVRSTVATLEEEGVEFNVCGNTLKAMDLSLDEMLPGMVEVSQGGVTRIAELQSQGYVYIRP